ncbi:hypothetical protein D3C87_954680 [compost metagenome]
MKMSTTAKRIGLAQIEVVVKDFITSGFMAMFTSINSEHSFRVAEELTLQLRYADKGKTMHLYLTLINERSKREETVVYTLKRGNEAEVSVEPPKGSYTQNYMSLANTLARAIVIVQDSVTVDGKERINYPGGTGYSAIDNEGVAEAFVRMRNNGTPGVAN